MGHRKRTTWTKETAPSGPGRPRLPEELKAARKLTKVAFESVVHQFTNMTKEQIIRKLKDPETPALELMVGSVVKEAIVKGDQQRLNFLLDRLVGKVREQVDVYGMFAAMSNDQLIVRAKALLLEAEEDEPGSV